MPSAWRPRLFGTCLLVTCTTSAAFAAFAKGQCIPTLLPSAERVRAHDGFKQSYSHFGHALAVGLLGPQFVDPYNDVVTTAPDQDVNGQVAAGMAFLYQGPALTPYPNGRLQSPSPAPNDELGLYSVVAGDFTGDGFDEVVVAARSKDVAACCSCSGPGPACNLFGQPIEDAGEVYIFDVMGQGVASPWRTLRPLVPSCTDVSRKYFGNSLALADVDADGLPDLIVGAPLAGLTGKAYLFFSQRNWSNCPGDVTVLDPPVYLPNGPVYFGWALATAFLREPELPQPDSKAEVIVGEPDRPFSAGRVLVFSGEDLFPPSVSSAIPRDILVDPTSNPNAAFGWNVAAGSLNELQDVLPDLIVHSEAEPYPGLPNCRPGRIPAAGSTSIFLANDEVSDPGYYFESYRDGRVYSLYATSSGLSGRFQGTLDWNGDSYQDLLVTGPGDNDQSTTIIGKGYCYIFRGPFMFPTPQATLDLCCPYWILRDDEAAPNLPHNSESFGRALAIGNYKGAGQPNHVLLGARDKNFNDGSGGEFPAAGEFFGFPPPP